MTTTLHGGPHDGTTIDGDYMLIQAGTHRYDGTTGQYLNPLPEFVLFPRLQRVLDVFSLLKVRLSDALTTLRYGLPDNED